MSFLQDSRDAPEHRGFLRLVPSRGGDDGPVRQQDHLERDQGGAQSDHVPAGQHEVQGNLLSSAAVVSRMKLHWTVDILLQYRHFMAKLKFIS